MYDPDQREKANQLQRELSEGKVAKEALKAMQDQVKEVCRCQDYSPKSELPHEVMRDLIVGLHRCHEELHVEKQAHKALDTLSREMHRDDVQMISQLQEHLAAQDKLIVAYYVDSREMIDEALKNIGKLKRGGE